MAIQSALALIIMNNNKSAIIANGLGKKFKRDFFSGGFALQNYLENLARKPIKNLEKLFSNGNFKVESLSNSQYFWALKEVSFEIKQGETVGLTGHNGAGKSVLLKILSQITKPSEGTAEIRGKCSSML